MSRSICTRICFAFPWDIKIWMLCVQNDSDCNKDWLRQWKWDPTTLWFYKDFEAFLYNSKIILKNAFANWVNCFCITPRDGSKSQQPEFVLEADLFLNTSIGNPWFLILTKNAWIMEPVALIMQTRVAWIIQSYGLCIQDFTLQA